MKRMLINATQKEELRVALVDGQRLYDLDIETISGKQKKANIYKGKITRVEPSLEAAFVDYGAERHGFLPIKEITKSYFSGSTATNENGRPDYKKLIREGQEVMVQVDKEERGNKGAALTTYIGLAGRYLVCMPNNPRGGGVSRRVQGSERRELRETLDKIDVPEEVGVIIRTAGVGRNYEELQWDLNYQMQVWQAVSDAYEQSSIGALLYQESNIIVRALRDYFREDIAEIIVDDEAVYQRAHGFMSLVMPDKIRRLKRYDDELPLFTRYQIEAQIDSAYGRNVRLPSGGELVIDYTEAMVSIDINSARSTKGGDVEETALHTNLEAAEEVARQLRLRDIGGLIVVDFIDMYDAKHRRQVEEKMRDAIRIDRARVQLARISKFGLLEMSRQRLRPSIDEASHKVCPRCKGQGSIRSTQSVALSVLRLIEEDANKDSTAKIVAQLPVKVATYLSNEKREAISLIEKRNNVSVILVSNETLQTPNFDLQRIRNDDDNIDGMVSYKIARDFNMEDALDDSAVKVDAHSAQAPIVAEIEPTAPPPKPKMSFFKLIKKALGFTDGEKSEKSAPQSNRKPSSKNERNSRQNNNDHVNNKRKRRKAFEESAETKKEERKSNGRKPRQNKKSDAKKGEVTDNTVKKQPDERKKSSGKRSEKKAVTAKPFVNEFATDKSKLQDGRPVSEDAVRGAGKADYQTDEQDEKVKAPKAKMVVEVANEIADHSDTKQPKQKRTPRKRSKYGNNVDRIFVPRAVDDSVPALSMSDETDVDMSSVPEEVVAEKTALEKPVETAILKENPIVALSSFGQSVWYDHISREMLASGELQRLVDEDDVRGVTSNPAIFEKALLGNHPEYVEFLSNINSSFDSPKAAFFALAVRDIKAACEAMRATFDKTDGTDGMVSLEVSPDLAYDAEKTIEEAINLNQQLNQPNAMIKVPGTEVGLVAIEELTYLGININVTLLFSVARYVDVFKAYMRGLQRRHEMGLPIDGVRSVASFFISRIDAIVDETLKETNPEIKGAVAIANAKIAYDAYLRLLESEDWKMLSKAGAKPQRLLWASTGTKDPSYSDVLYVEQLIGKETVNTLPPETYIAFKAHGKVSETLTKNVLESKALIELLPQYGVDFPAITERLERDGIVAFETAFDALLSLVSDKMK